jgi:uncharacterized membrane protein YphA (DoxX/SURF4 family)
MHPPSESRYLRMLIAVLRIVLGLIILVTWWENLQKGLYTVQGITDLLTHPDWGAFSNGGGALPGYQPIIEATVLRVPGAFGAFQMMAEMLIGLGLLFGALTPMAGAGAGFFFLNLLLTYLGNSQGWIWTYVLLFAVAIIITLARSGRELGIDKVLLRKFSKPPLGVLW